MAYLLENGAEIGEGTLGAASMHGNADCVRIVLDYGASHDDNIICESLIRAVEGEHEEVLRLLLRSFTPLDEELWKKRWTWREIKAYFRWLQFLRSTDSLVILHSTRFICYMMMPCVLEAEGVLGGLDASTYSVNLSIFAEWFKSPKNGDYTTTDPKGALRSS
ncbi:hypothetical protein PG984_013873 [Apiospora sp. TS-2023a]